MHRAAKVSTGSAGVGAPAAGTTPETAEAICGATLGKGVLDTDAHGGAAIANAGKSYKSAAYSKGRPGAFYGSTRARPGGNED